MQFTILELRASARIITTKLLIPTDDILHKFPLHVVYPAIRWKHYPLLTIVKPLGFYNFILNGYESIRLFPFYLNAPLVPTSEWPHLISNSQRYRFWDVRQSKGRWAFEQNRDIFLPKSRKNEINFMLKFRTHLKVVSQQKNFKSNFL